MLPGGHASKLAERKAVQTGSQKHLYMRFGANSKELEEKQD